MKEHDKLGALNIDNSVYQTRLSKKFKNRIPYKAPDPNIILSFIPGTVLDILVEPGAMVRPGDALMILDAMKMQNQLKCSIEGRVKRIVVKKGDKVSKGSVLLELEQIKEHLQK
jgi:biotin carboxyl carrier protein